MHCLYCIIPTENTPINGYFSVITDDEMELAIRQIADYCRRYDGGSEHAIGGLLEDLNEYLSLKARGQATQSSRDTFVNAVSTLVLIASPPGRDQFESTLASLSQLTDSSITTVAFDREPLAVDRNQLNWHPFEVELPPRRQLKDADVALIAYLRQLLSD